MVWTCRLGKKRKAKEKKREERTTLISFSSFLLLLLLLLLLEKRFFLSFFLTFWLSFYVWRTRACVQIHIHTARDVALLPACSMCVFASRCSPIVYISSFPRDTVATVLHRCLITTWLIRNRFPPSGTESASSPSLLATRDLLSPRKEEKRNTNECTKEKKRKKIVSFFQWKSNDLFLGKDREGRERSRTDEACSLSSVFSFFFFFSSNERRFLE